MKRYTIKGTLCILALAAGLHGCVNDLDTIPLDENTITSATYYTNEASYKQVLAKIYGGLSLTGQIGPNGDQDVRGGDEGATNYVRSYWYMQDITTEMGLWTWNDPGIPQLQLNGWTSSNEIVLGMYSRIYFQVALANELVREASEDKINALSISEADKEAIRMYRNEARLLRALSYYHALDLFGSVPFVTENDKVGAFLPPQISKADLFSYIEAELKDLEDQLAAPLQNEFGRVDVVAAWMILAKLYLNAEVYIGEAKYTEAITYAKKVMDSAYELEPDYKKLFQADNHTAKGIILSAVHDGINAQTWGGTTMLACSAWATDMDAASYGIDAWGGNRARKQLVDKFADPSGATDKRAMFFTAGRTVTTDDIAEFTNGYSVTKYRNINSDGSLGSNIQHMDIDFPMLRLADAHLMLAEAVLRGGSGASVADAVAAVNQVRERAYQNTTGNITGADLTLAFILDERAREFYWEGYRRTDLVRYGLFTSSSYLWEWKGGVYEGRALPDHFNHFPIPASDISANPNLKQDGY